jgi:chaperone modulatory protein CbpM
MSDEELLTLEELALVCSVTPEWVRVRVEEGLLPAVPEWRFSAVTVRRARRMHALERDFDAAPELAALMADLLEELDALRARLR